MCWDVFVFEGSVFLFVLETSHLKKNPIFLGCLCKKPKLYQKATCRMLSVGDHKSTALQRTELLIATAFSAALIFSSCRGRYCSRYYTRYRACLAM